jgi:serine/threonine protein kinase
VATTLRFTAPEIIRDQTRQVRPTKECDIWSFGCLCYEACLLLLASWVYWHTALRSKVLSRKVPYYEYQLDAQVLAALFRGQLPKRPGPTKNDNDEDDDWDEIDEKDWDDLDDSTWGWIMKCIMSKPEDRPSASRIQELIVDMRVWDSRPAAKGVPGAEILKQKSNIEVNLNRAGTILDQLQVCYLFFTMTVPSWTVTVPPKILFLVRSMYRYSDQHVIAAVINLSQDDVDILEIFWDLVCRL